MSSTSTKVADLTLNPSVKPVIDPPVLNQQLSLKNGDDVNHGKNGDDDDDNHEDQQLNYQHQLDDNRPGNIPGNFHHHHHHQNYSIIDNNEGIYSNYNIDYDNDYEQFYDKQQQQQRHYLLQDSNSNNMYDEEYNPEFDNHHQQHYHHIDSIVDDDPYHPIQYFYNDEDDNNQSSVDGNHMIDPTTMLYQNVEHQTGILSDARTYGLPTFLPQQQQQIQQHMLAIPDGQNGSIYGNPLVYSLHTIYEESENESSLQTLSSLTSTSLTIRPDSVNQQQQQQSFDKEFKHQQHFSGSSKEKQQFSIVITNDDRKSLSKNSVLEMKNIPHWNNMNDDDYVEEEEDEEELDLVDNIQPFNDSITLSSKLERYFTSGLLETTNNNCCSTYLPMEKSQDHQQQQDEQQQKSINSRRKFDRIECFCNFLQEMISSIKISKTSHTVTDDDDDLSKISEHIDRLNCLFCLDLKRFIIKMILMIKLSTRINGHRYYDDDINGKCLKAIYSNQNSSISNNNDDDQLSIVRIIDRLSRQKNINNNDENCYCGYSYLQLESLLIIFMIEKIFRHTQIDHLLFDHQFWSYEFDRLYRPNLAASILKTRRSSSSSTSGKTIIKVTVNGRLVPTVETTTGFNAGISSPTSSHQSKVSKNLPIFNQPKKFSSNSDSSIRILQSIVDDNKTIDLFRSSKNPEYRTILQINDPHQQSSSSVIDDEDDCLDIETLSSSSSSTTTNNCTNKLNKFLRVSNPLNRSFLAKISPIENESDSNNNNKSSINGELSISSWTNESIIDDNNIEDTNQSLASNSLITKQRCSSEKLEIGHSNSTDQTSRNHESIDEQNAKKQSSNNVHRNSFKNFSNSTLDHLYEMIRNPFKSSSSSKKRKRKPQIDSIVQNENGSSKSSSEPNLTNKHKQRKNNGHNHLSANIDHSLDKSDDLNGKVFHSKSTPQLLTTNNEHQNDYEKSMEEKHLKSITMNQSNGNTNFRRNYSLEKHVDREENICHCNHDQNTLISRLNGLSPSGSHLLKGNQLQRSLSGSQISSPIGLQWAKSTCNFCEHGSSTLNPTKQQQTTTVIHSSSQQTQLAKQPFMNKFSSFRNNQPTTTTLSLSSSFTNSDEKNHFDREQSNQQITTKPSSGNSCEEMAIIGRIFLSIYYETKLNSLTITIFRCHLNMIKKNKNDLYIKAYIIADHQREKAFKKKTKIKKPLKIETTNGSSIYEVEYNEILRFQGKWREFVSGQLSISLWNNDTFGRNLVIGQTLIRLNDSMMLNSIQTRIWYDLYQPNKIKCQSVHVKGSLFIAIKHEDSAIMSTGHHINNDGSLHVLIKEADDLNLNQYNINGYSYCKVMLKPERNKDDRQKTKSVKMGQCPRWNETIVFRNISKTDMNVKELEIAIMWQDKSTKTYMGSIRLTNHEDSSNEEQNLWRQSIERPNLWAYGKIPLRH